MTSVQASSDTPILGGIPLAQYAAVVAGMREGFLLEEVLDVEHLALAKWGKAELLWRKQIATDGEMLERYGAMLAEAEDRLTRSLDPLDRDIESWIEFLRIWSKHLAPMDLLEQHGLGMNDLARLRRQWGAKMESSKELADRAAKLQKREAAPKPLRIICAAPVLKPSRYAAAASAPESSIEPEAAEKQRADLGVEDLAQLLSELDAQKRGRKAIYAHFGIGSLAQGEAFLADLEKRMASDPILRSDIRSRRAHLERRRTNAEDPTRATEVPRIEAPGSSLAAPPVALQGPPPAADSPSTPARGGNSARSGVDATHDMLRSVPGPALPFGRAASPEFVAALNAKREPKRRPVPRDPRDETVALPSIIDSKASMPFVSPSAPLSRENVDVTAEVRAISSEPVLPFAKTPSPPREDVNVTTEVRAISSEPVLPFTKTSSRDIGASGPTSPRPRPRRDARDETVATPAIAPLGPATPFEKGSRGSAPAPKLTLEQYASLEAELLATPDRRKEVLVRYGVEGPGALQQLGTAFARLFEAQPELRRRWQGLVSEYRAWLVRSR